MVILGQRLIVPDGHGSGYEPIPGVSRKTALPRLRPGQAGRAVVEQPAVAAPLVQPVLPEAPPTGVKRSGGVAWPSDHLGRRWLVVRSAGGSGHRHRVFAGMVGWPPGAPRATPAGRVTAHGMVG